MPVYEINSFRGGLSDYNDKGLPGSFKMGSNLSIRKEQDSLSCNQALVDEGAVAQSASASVSPSASRSPSTSLSPSISPSISPSSSLSPSFGSQSASISPSASRSPSSSSSPSASLSPSTSVSPSPSPSAGISSVNIFKDLVLWFVKASDGNVYGFGNTGYIYKRNPYAAWSVVYKARSTIKGAYEFPASNGKTYLFFALDTELHRKEIPGNAAWNDVDQIVPGTADPGYPKTNLTSQDWHTMREAGGSLLICNGSSLALVGYDQSYTNNALNLLPGNISKTLVERSGRTIVGTYRGADPTKGINGAIDAEFPLAQVGDAGQIFFANLTDSIPVKTFPGGGKINPGGVTNQIDQMNFFEWEQNALNFISKQAVGNMALFGVYGASTGKGGVYSYGRVNKNHQPTLNLDYLLDVDQIGAITSIGGVVLASYQSGSTFGVKAVDQNNKATGTFEGLEFKAAVKRVIDRTVWDIVELYFDPLPSGASLQFWYKINKSGSFVQAYTADTNVQSFTTANAKKAVFRVNAEGEIYEPKVVMVPTGNNSPEVHRIRTYFR